ncbi:nucleocapsid protein [Ruloma virus]|uniref:Nucleocapsid n=1 Tax=Ruloma virus TaxID=2811341 RepID=A0AAE7Q2Z3_9MONO|nr:nucleocapsid protein [Ruloma virus]QRN45784.1 nucleocapsid protein [Ruloma virus]
MAGISDTIKDFKQFKSNPTPKGVLSTAFQGVKNKILVLVPVNLSPPARFALMYMLLKLVWSPIAPGSVVTGAFFSLLTFFAEQPGQLLRAMIGDPDIEVQILEVTDMVDGSPKLATRGASMENVEKQYRVISETHPKENPSGNPFIIKQLRSMIPLTVEDLQIAVGTITLQIWILLTKAVTAPDTARDSETRRWLKYTQQRRADRLFRLEPRWLDNARQRIAADLPVRRLMVNILIEVNQSSGVKGRIVEMIADVGNYIAESGMAGFFTTVKYGIETKYSALALNELQGDLNTVLGLMKYYQSLGPRAPYLVILEDSAQIKFAPGGYPLLYSYAMGIATALDRSMAGLIYDKGYLEPSFFRLGRSMVHHLEGNLNSKVADELGITSEQRDELKNLLKSEGVIESEHSDEPKRQARQVLLGPTSVAMEDIIPVEEKEYVDYLKSKTEALSSPIFEASTTYVNNAGVKLGLVDELKRRFTKRKEETSATPKQEVSEERRRDLQDELRTMLINARQLKIEDKGKEKRNLNRMMDQKPTTNKSEVPTDIDVINQS